MGIDLTTRPSHHRDDAVPGRAGTREWTALVVLMLPVLMVSMDNTVLGLALPSISAALAPSGTELLWIVDIYALMLAGLLVPMGSLGDRIGRRRLLLVGALGFGAVSVLAAYSPTVEVLIASRALLGVFGATLMPSTMSLIRNMFHDRTQRRLAIAVWAAGFSGGAALGPIVGGYLLGHAWWGSVFCINVPVVLALVALTRTLVPESRDPAPGPLDLTSIVLSMTAMLPIAYAIKAVAEHGLSGDVTAAAAVGVTSAVVFVRRQRMLSHPMVDLDLFADRAFSGALVSNLLSIMALAGFLFFAAQLLQLVLGLGPMAAAMTLVPGLVATIIAGLVAVRLVRYVPVRTLVSASFVVSATGYAILAFVGGAPTTATIMVAFAVLGTGIGMAETLTNDVIVASAPPHQAGAAAAISETAYEIGAVLGTAVLGGILTATYRAGVIVPFSVTVPGSDRAAETLGAATGAASSLTPGAAQVLLGSAQAAFDVGVQRASAVAIAVALAAAVVAHVTLREDA